MKRNNLIYALGVLMLVIQASPLSAGPMEEEKLYTLPDRKMGLHPRMAELMGWAIAQPDELTILSGLLDISRLKITDLSGKVTALVEDPRPLIRTTASQTLGALDTKAAADKLLAVVKLQAPYNAHQFEQIQSADGLLSRWGDKRAVSTWTARLQNKNNPLLLRRSAAVALGPVAVGDPNGVKALLPVVLDPSEPMPLRLVAADSLGQVKKEGSEDFTAALIKQGSNGKLLAPRVLRHHGGDKALTILVALANDAQPAVQGPALQRLLEADAKRIWPTADKLLTSPDPLVRLYSVRACYKWFDRKSVDLMAKTVDDAHPDVRNEARKVLFELAKQEPLNPPIKEAMRNWINQGVVERGKAPAPHWRAAEQAALLAGLLDDKPANPALLLLVDELEHPRLDVKLAAVDALRRLHMPESRQPMVKLMKRLIDRIEARVESSKKEKDQVAAQKNVAPANEADSRYAAETAQTLGVWYVSESDPILRRLIPKHHPAYPIARASAIWALGWLHENKPEEKLVGLLIDRINDLNPLDPEAHEVRLQGIIALGRMKVDADPEKPAMITLRIRYEQDGLEIKAAARWARMHITGEKLEELTLEPGLVSDAFISPLD